MFWRSESAPTRMRWRRWARVAAIPAAMQGRTEESAEVPLPAVVFCVPAKNHVSDPAVKVSHGLVPAEGLPVFHVLF